MSVREIFESACRNGKHPFVVIDRSGPDMVEKVVRWCDICGAIAIDVDYDGRTQPGWIMPVRRPKILERT